MHPPASRPPDTPTMGARHTGTVRLKALVKGVESTMLPELLQLVTSSVCFLLLGAAPEIKKMKSKKRVYTVWEAELNRR